MGHPFTFVNAFLPICAENRGAKGECIGSNVESENNHVPLGSLSRRAALP